MRDFLLVEFSASNFRIERERRNVNLNTVFGRDILHLTKKCNLCELFFFARIVNNNDAGFRLREQPHAIYR